MFCMWISFEPIRVTSAEITLLRDHSPQRSLSLRDPTYDRKWVGSRWRKIGRHEQNGGVSDNSSHTVTLMVTAARVFEAIRMILLDVEVANLFCVELYGVDYYNL
ncbi:hypothetical protein DPEC_G00216490, partial [Dallia pectoralis]